MATTAKKTATKATAKAGEKKLKVSKIRKGMEKYKGAFSATEAVSIAKLCTNL